MKRKVAGAGRSMVADAESKIDDIFAADDKVVMRMTMRGIYIGEPVPGFPKKGERFAMGAVAIYRFVDGKIVDDWGIQLTCPTDSPWG
jgi:predicted ester cyclase